MRIIFMGTPEFSVPILQALVDAGHDVMAAYSQPPRPAGRGKGLTVSPVQARAEALGIAIRTPPTLRDAAVQEEFVAFRADVAVVAAYGLILPRVILETPRLGCINVHASLLPRWRGAAPIQRAILAGDEETGVGIMQMEVGLDTGPVMLEDRTPIGTKTAGALTEELSTMGARLMAKVLADLDRYPPVAQPAEGMTYAPKIDKAEARIDWDRAAEDVARQVRAFNPVPGAYLEFHGERLKLLAVDIVDAAGAAGVVIDDRLTIACGEGAVRPTLIQRAGRGMLSAVELLRGFPIPAGTQF